MSRDLQLLLMHFLNKVRSTLSGIRRWQGLLLMLMQVHFNSPMSLLTKDCASKPHDKKLLGALHCKIGNREAVFNHDDAGQYLRTWTGLLSPTYSNGLPVLHFPSHGESLFGLVTCLPGCFMLYRLRTGDTHNLKPLLISNQLVDDY